MSIGEALAAARRQRGLTVEDVARATRIRPPLVYDIEADRFDSCRGAVYARGHIRSIAELVGADAAALVAEFDRTHHVELPLPTALQTASREVKYADRTGAGWVAAVLIVVGALAGLWLLGTMVAPNEGDRLRAITGADGPSPSEVDGASAPASPSPATTPSPPSPPPPAGTPSASPPADGGGGPVPGASGVEVRLQVTGERSWVRASQADTVIFEGVLGTGEVREFAAAEELSLVLGNAAAVSLVVNGKDIGPLGASGEVVTVSYGPGAPNPDAGSSAAG